jgi:cerebroside-sulfatase
MEKLNFLQKTVSIGLVFVPVLPAVAQQKPNVVFIYADDMGKGMISAYGQKHFTTPYMDRMVREGTAFANAYGCMLSAPARASMLTGYHDCHTDKWHLSEGAQFVCSVQDTAWIAEVEKRLDAEDVLLPSGDLYLPQVFQRAGYVTAQIGKLEWGFTATRKQMKAHGWDYYYGYLDHVRCHGFYPPFLFDNGQIDVIDGNTRINGGKSLEPETPAAYADRWNMEGKRMYSQDIFLEKILSFIREHKNEPFFLFHPTQLPHGPVAIPQIHPELATKNELTSIEKEYASMVKMLDEQIGLIWNELERLHLEENTILILASDNGHEIYYSEKERCEKPYRNMETGKLFDDYTDKYYSDKAGDRFNGNAGMAGLKRSNLDGGAHIPLIVYWQGHWTQGTNTQLVSMYDLLPTFADLLNVKLPMKKDGISILPALDKQKSVSKKRYVVYGSNLGPAIVTNEGWKLRHYRHKNVFELYNLRKDAQERKNVIEKYPRLAKKLKTILLKECGGDFANGINRAG